MSKNVDNALQDEIQKEPDMFDDMSNEGKSISNPEKEEKTNDSSPEVNKQTDKQAKEATSSIAEEIQSKTSGKLTEGETSTEGEDSEGQKEEIKKLEKRFYDVQKYARRQQQKNQDVSKLIDALVESADIDEDVADKLKTPLKKAYSDNEGESFVNNVTVETPHPLSEYKDMLTPEIFQTYIEVSEDTEATNKIKAFDQYLLEAEPQELEGLEKELSQLKDPMSVLKKILFVGNNFLKHGMGEFYQHGGFKKFLKAKNDEKQKLQKELDKANKKLLEYESNKTAGSWLGSTSSGSGAEKLTETGDMFNDMSRDLEYNRQKRRN